jgi:hypothetical protein
MKPLICPQCGGRITNYLPTATFADCEYCTTRFLIQHEKPKPTVQLPVYNYPAETSSNPNIFLIGLVAASLVFGTLIILAVSFSRNKPADKYSGYSKPNFTTTPKISPSPTPNLNLLEFGARGTGEGTFVEANSITVDSKGKIYVADSSLRVQQFDEKGVYLKTWQIPSETKLYGRARQIDKILVDGKDELHVQVGGVVLVYRGGSSEPYKAINFAPNPIQDFAFRSDGGKLFIVNDGKIETLYHISQTGKTLQKIAGFHTKTADAVISPQETGVEAIRLTVDGTGNIFSVYAFGDLGSYQLSYNAEDLMIFRFSPEGRYVNKFAQSMNSCGIEVDNLSRIYVSDINSIGIYSTTGGLVGMIPGLGKIDAFALDKQNNVYIVKDNLVIKRPAFD